MIDRLSISEGKTMDLSWAKRQRGTACASITRLKENVGKLEERAELSRTDHLMISRLIKKLKNWDSELRKKHDVVLDLVEDDSEVLKQEQRIYDKHDKKFSMLLSFHLQELARKNDETVHTSKPADEAFHHLERRLRYIDSSLKTIHESINRLIPGRGFDECLLQALEKRMDKLASELSDITHDILFTTGDERTLMDQ